MQVFSMKLGSKSKAVEGDSHHWTKQYRTSSIGRMQRNIWPEGSSTRDMVASEVSTYVDVDIHPTDEEWNTFPKFLQSENFVLEGLA